VGSGPPLSFSRWRAPGTFSDPAQEQGGSFAPILGVYRLNVLFEEAQLLLPSDKGCLDASSRKRG